MVPIYFVGANSRLWQVASHIHATLRMALLINEFKRRVDEPVQIAVGKPIDRAELDARRSDPKAMIGLSAAGDLCPLANPAQIDGLRVRVRGQAQARSRGLGPWQWEFFRFWGSAGSPSSVPWKSGCRRFRSSISATTRTRPTEVRDADDIYDLTCKGTGRSLRRRLRPS